MWKIVMKISIDCYSWILNIRYTFTLIYLTDKGILFMNPIFLYFDMILNRIYLISQHFWSIHTIQEVFDFKTPIINDSSWWINRWWRVGKITMKLE